MRVQIFGTQSCQDTRKAERFFKERRATIHFVDLRRRPASRGELRNFVERFGAEAIVDRESRRAEAKGYAHADYSDERWIEILEREPMILRTPLVRFGNEFTVGLDEETWREWAG